LICITIIETLLIATRATKKLCKSMPLVATSS
jgi:hypothetical protein